MITYLLKVTLCSGVLLLFYRLLLEREKTFRFNRYFLLGSLLLSVGLPLVPIEIFTEQAFFAPSVAAAELAERGIQARYTVALAPQPTLPDDTLWPWVLGLAYALVSGALLVRLSRNLYQLLQRIRRHEVVPERGLRLVLLDHCPLPHSFLHYVFVERGTYRQGGLEQEILDHERAHVQQGHSLDILLVEVLKAVGWVNPFFYYYRHYMAQNHEYLADEAVIRKYRNIPSYQLLLLQKTLAPFHPPLTSSFNFSFTKKRFVMMNKHTSRTRALLAQVAVLPLLAIALFAFSDLTLAQIAPPPPPVEKAPPPPPVERRGSSDLVKEYNILMNKYMVKNEDGTVSLKYPALEDGKKMIALREAMSKEQADTLRFKIYYSKPLPKDFLSKEEFEKYKNPNMYGIWLNGKKIANSALDKYNQKDLIQGFISRVYPNAQPKTGYKYKYQVDLMTEDYYNSYRKEYLVSPKFRLVRRDS
jgi:bla regulator protein blaR1